ncbi:MAG: 16S rRNA (cytosine(1402)-N(4))-methyltransferase RsmH [Lentisphaerae bacterium]|nr:16S rRNA (cytosine(1402)-N(4))-methyltransferase RsmH [Lentisphaerota bacterium]
MSSAEQNWVHIPVLAAEAVELLSSVKPLRRLVDGTLGNGGHSRMLLENNPELQILGIDRDSAALERANKNLQQFGSRFTAVHGEFADLDKLAAAHGWDQVDAVLLDIGVSSPQLDDPARGFSFRGDGPLDMRMDRQQKLTASRVLNFYSEEELARVFRDYGELRESRQLARRIVQLREEKPFSTTAELTAVCDKVLRKKRPGELPSPTLVFQALRIEVNGELEQLKSGLQAAKNILRPGGRLAVISFHSLEDRIVKNFMRDAAQNCICPPGLPVCVCNHRAEFTLPVRGVISAKEEELNRNRRAACAKLRVADRT